MKKIILFTLIFILLIGNTAFAGFSEWSQGDKVLFTVYIGLTGYEIFQAYDNSWEKVIDTDTFVTENTYTVEGSTEIRTEETVIIETRWMNNGGQIMPSHFTPPLPARRNFTEIEIEYVIEKEYYEKTEDMKVVTEKETTTVINEYQDNDFLIGGKIITELVLTGFLYGIADGVEEQHRTPVLLAGTALKTYMIYKNNNEVKLSLYNFAF